MSDYTFTRYDVILLMPTSNVYLFCLYLFNSMKFFYTKLYCVYLQSISHVKLYSFDTRLLWAFKQTSLFWSRYAILVCTSAYHTIHMQAHNMHLPSIKTPDWPLTGNTNTISYWYQYGVSMILQTLTLIVVYLVYLYYF